MKAARQLNRDALFSDMNNIGFIWEFADAAFEPEKVDGRRRSGSHPFLDCAQAAPMR